MWVTLHSTSQKNDFTFLTKTILKSLIIKNNRCTLVYLKTVLGEIKEVKAGMALHRIWGLSTPSDNIFAYVELDNNYNLFTLTHCLTDNKSCITNFFSSQLRLVQDLNNWAQNLLLFPAIAVLDLHGVWQWSPEIHQCWRKWWVLIES